MEKHKDQIFVRSHTGRDLLQSAALSKTDKLVVWEYVSNGLQYVDPGVNALVQVTLDSKKKRMSVRDNGRGMDWSDLQTRYFVMHGENIDRKEGRPGRGRFGTGKSAAFGIADVLRLTSVRNGKRSKVELLRSDVEAMSAGDPVPVRTVERETPTQEPSGTVVEIERIHLKSLDQAGIIHYIERHLARWPKHAVVFVNNHECEFAEPPIDQERRFQPEGEARAKLGDVDLVINVSRSPLEEDLRGVSIFANGVWYETTLAGSEGREMTQYIFGEIDVPKLDEDSSPIAALDMARSMRLNPSNELVQAIYAFIGQKIDLVRRELAETEKERKAGEEAKKLARQAEEIARVINEDFAAFRERLMKAKAWAAGDSDAYSPERSGATDPDDLLFGAELPAVVVSPDGGPGATRDHGGGGADPPMAPQVLPGSPLDEKKGRPVGGEDGKARPRGGFDVRFRDMGEESYRAEYVRDERRIYINTDHPQLVAARGTSSIDEPLFRRLAYEIAFSEYAVALASELAARDEYYDFTDPIVEIRETLNRVARKAALLYAE